MGVHGEGLRPYLSLLGQHPVSKEPPWMPFTSRFKTTPALFWLSVAHLLDPFFTGVTFFFVIVELNSAPFLILFIRHFKLQAQPLEVVH